MLFLTDCAQVYFFTSQAAHVCSTIFIIRCYHRQLIIDIYDNLHVITVGRLTHGEAMMTIYGNRAELICCLCREKEVPVHGACGGAH